MAFAALIHKYDPTAIDFRSMDASAGLANAKLVCSVLEKMGIKRVFEPAELVFSTTINMVADQLVEYVSSAQSSSFDSGCTWHFRQRTSSKLLQQKIRRNLQLSGHKGSNNAQPPLFLANLERERTLRCLFQSPRCPYALILLSYPVR